VAGLVAAGFQVSIRLVLRILLGTVAMLLILALAAVLVVHSIDWKPRLERYASEALGRRVTVGGFAIGWSRPLALDLTDVGIANADWGSAPDMLGIARLSARLDLAPLLQTRLRFQRLALDGVELLLERNADGAANWRFDKAGARGGSFVLVPHSRGEFPTLLEAELQDAHLTYRRPSARELRLDIATLAIAAPDESGAAHLELTGAYDGKRASLVADTDGFTTLRDATVPFATNITLSSGASRLAFAGSMMKPLDFDGVAGRLSIAADQTGDLLAFFGAKLALAAGLDGEGDFSREGERWQLQSARGRLAGNAYEGELLLNEAPRGQPDDLGLSLRFADLDLRPLVGDVGNGPVDITLDPHPGANLTLDLAARRVLYGKMAFADVRLRAGSAPARITVEELAMGLLGGRFTAAGKAETAGRGTALSLQLALDGAQAGEIARLFGGAPDDIAGPVAARASVQATGATLDGALRQNTGPIIISMRKGRIARALIEHASTDLLSLFRKGLGSLPISCALASVELRNGRFAVNPLLLRTADTAVRATGLVDALRRALDLEISARGGTSLLALNVPVRIAGRFDRLTVQPAIGSGAGATGRGPRQHLSPEMADFLKRNACRG
jgi:AsmA family protein